MGCAFVVSALTVPIFIFDFFSLFLGATDEFLLGCKFVMFFLLGSPDGGFAWSNGRFNCYIFLILFYSWFIC